jgi:hypothetical protein
MDAISVRYVLSQHSRRNAVLRYNKAKVKKTKTDWDKALWICTENKWEKEIKKEKR